MIERARHWCEVCVTLPFVKLRSGKTHSLSDAL